MRTIDRRRTGGFTLAEMVMVAAVLAILAAVTLPVAKYASKRSKELDLRQQLREMRSAIDEYKRYSDAGLIPVDLNTEGYPKKLEILVFGTTWADAKTGANPMVWSLPSGASGAPPASVTSSEAGHVTLSVSEVVPAVSPASAKGTVTVSATIEAQLP